MEIQLKETFKVTVSNYYCQHLRETSFVELNYYPTISELIEIVKNFYSIRTKENISETKIKVEKYYKVIEN